MSNSKLREAIQQQQRTATLHQLPLVPQPIQACVERITAAQADEILKARPTNRKISREVVAKYVRAMRRGRFKSLNGEGVIFNSDGGLEGGQHRLTALIESGLPFMDFLVVRGVEPRSYETHDQGRARTTSDVATERGYKHSRVLIAAVRWLWIYNKEWPGGLSHSPVLTTDELLEYLAANEELCVAEGEVRKSYPGASKLLMGSIAVLVRLVTDNISPEQSNAFFHTLHTGEPTPTSRQVLKLRDRLIAREGQAHRLKPAEIIILAARVWNAMREGREVQKLMIVRDSLGEGGNPYRTAPRFE